MRRAAAQLTNAGVVITSPAMPGVVIQLNGDGAARLAMTGRQGQSQEAGFPCSRRLAKTTQESVTRTDRSAKNAEGG
jgi:hypothetical protein